MSEKYTPWWPTLDWAERKHTASKNNPRYVGSVGLSDEYILNFGISFHDEEGFYFKFLVMDPTFVPLWNVFGKANQFESAPAHETLSQQKSTNIK